MGSGDLVMIGRTESRRDLRRSSEGHAGEIGGTPTCHPVGMVRVATTGNSPTRSGAEPEFLLHSALALTTNRVLRGTAPAPIPRLWEAAEAAPVLGDMTITVSRCSENRDSPNTRGP